VRFSREVCGIDIGFRGRELRSDEDVAFDRAEYPRAAAVGFERRAVAVRDEARSSGCERTGVEAARRRRHCWPDMLMARSKEEDHSGRQKG